MYENTRYHSVRLDKDLCKGCTNCLTHCPTAAIRVRGGRAHILDNLCIDCGAPNDGIHTRCKRCVARRQESNRMYKLRRRIREGRA